MIIFWRGIVASDSGRRVHGFFNPKEMVNSATCCTMLRRKAVKVLKEENLILCQDQARLHISKMTSKYLANEGINSMTTPGRSPDALPIENVFAIIKRRLKAVPTNTIEEVKMEVTKVWRGLYIAYLEELCTSLRRRCSAYCLTIYRYAIIVSFSKYRRNIAFFWTTSHDIYLISTHTENPYR